LAGWADGCLVSLLTLAMKAFDSGIMVLDLQRSVSVSLHFLPHP